MNRETGPPAAFSHWTAPRETDVPSRASGRVGACIGWTLQRQDGEMEAKRDSQSPLWRGSQERYRDNIRHRVSTRNSPKRRVLGGRGGVRFLPPTTNDVKESCKVGCVAGHGAREGRKRGGVWGEPAVAPPQGAGHKARACWGHGARHVLRPGLWASASCPKR